MAKKSISKNILKAMTIGLSLMIANQPILSMAADDNTEENNENNNLENTQEEESIVKEAKDKTEETSNILNTSEGIAKEAIELTENVPSVSVIEASADFEEEVESDVKQNIDTPNIDVSQNDIALDLMETYEKLAEQKASEADEKAQLANDKITEAQNLVNEADKVVENAEKTVSDAEQVLEESKKTIAKTDKLGVATKAYKQAETAINVASDTVDKAETKLGEIQNDLNDVENAYNDAVNAFGTLSGEYTTTEGLFDSAKQDALAEDGNAGSRIEKIAASAEVLRAAAATAKESLENSDFYSIIILEKQIQDLLDAGKSVSYRGEGVSFANLFDAIVKNYYIPTMLNGEYVSSEWHRFSGDYVYDNNNVASTQGDVLNYCVVTYKDSEGQEQQKILNYKISNGNRTNDKNWPGIVIFEKTQHNDEYRNDNWYTGEVVLVTQDKEVGMDYKTDGKQPYDKDDMILDDTETQATASFRQTLKEAQDLADKYQSIAEKADAAQKKYQEANDKVKELIEIINKTNSNAVITKSITEFDSNIEQQLSQAVKDLEKVKKDRDDLVKELDKLKDQLDNKIKDLAKEEIPIDPAPGIITDPIVKEEPLITIPTVKVESDKVEKTEESSPAIEPVVTKDTDVSQDDIPPEIDAEVEIKVEEDEVALADTIEKIEPAHEVKTMNDMFYVFILFLLLLIIVLIRYIRKKIKEVRAIK